MMINLSRILLTGFFALALIACSKQASVSDSGASMTQAANSVSSSVVSRWYSGEQKALGSEVFAQNCAVCHGAQAQGTVEDWRARLDDGSFPPPPLKRLGSCLASSPRDSTAGS